MRQTRRSLLAFAPALPLALAAPAVAAAPDPDAALIAANARLEALRADVERLDADVDTAFLRALAARPRPPQVLTVRPDDWHVGFRHTGFRFQRDAVEAWRRGITEPSVPLMSWPLRTRYEARGREVVTAWDNWSAACRAADERAGLHDAQARAAAHDDAIEALEAEIFALQAVTPAGWRIKARIAADHLGASEGTYGDHLTRKLLADLLGAEVPPHLSSGAL